MVWHKLSVIRDPQFLILRHSDAGGGGVRGEPTSLGMSYRHTADCRPSAGGGANRTSCLPLGSHGLYCKEKTDKRNVCRNGVSRLNGSISNGETTNPWRRYGGASIASDTEYGVQTRADWLAASLKTRLRSANFPWQAARCRCPVLDLSISIDNLQPPYRPSVSFMWTQI